ncbi:MAG: hypothetical protein QNJ68_07070 [Microcoleaceae cyanobacterium MO_207.B10]|nr:hypothetical protein [Microcoleaceae cyanobacterium MO_207.B10]
MSTKCLSNSFVNFYEDLPHDLFVHLEDILLTANFIFENYISIGTNPCKTIILGCSPVTRLLAKCCVK